MISSTFELHSLPANYQLIKRVVDAKPLVFLTCNKGNYFIIKVSPASNPTKVLLYENEIRVSSNLNHPNILTPLDYGKQIHEDSSHDYFYIVNRYMPNQTMFEMFVKKKIRLTEILQRSFLHYLVSGIEYMHQNGKAHLDLKPNNILIGNDFIPKIFDFDRSYCDIFNKVLSCGTPCYTAPELLKKDPGLDPKKCDIYSLGIILFVLENNGCCTPFQETNGECDCMRSYMNETPSRFWAEMPSRFKAQNKSWSNEFKTLFEGMVRSNPNERYSLEDIKASEWYQGSVLSNDEFTEMMMEKYIEA